MTPQDALRRLSGDDGWHAHVQSQLTRVDELISEAKVRVAEHAAHMKACDRGLPLAVYALSGEVHQNLEEGLRLLMRQRDMLLRELASIARRKNVTLGLHFKLGDVARIVGG